MLHARLWVLIAFFHAGAAVHHHGPGSRSHASEASTEIISDGSASPLRAKAGHRHAHGPIPLRRSLLEYFKHWSKGKIELELRRSTEVDPASPSLLQTDSGTLSHKEATAVIARSRAEGCPDLSIGHAAASQPPFRVLAAEAADASSVRHALLRDGRGRLQYVAAHPRKNGRLRALVADPPSCARAGSALQQNPISLDSSAVKLADDPKLLRKDDPLVQDCEKLLRRTFKTQCAKSLDLEVVSATLVIIDGFMVTMQAKICTAADACGVQPVQCAFEVNGGSHYASLVQQEASLMDPVDPLPEEKLGMQATLLPSVPLCDMESAGDAAAYMLLQSFSGGELSRYKGFEHINDELPVWGALLDTDVPDEYDLRKEHRTCFPDLKEPDRKHPYEEIVRDQGRCGSCWAFASSTATATNMCISHGGQYMFNTVDDRAEVSVQKVISCDRKQHQGREVGGCNGGSTTYFVEAATKYGLAKEKHNPYQCGKTAPKKCTSFPWNGQCCGVPESGWLFGGAATVSGEASMKSYLSQGFALTSTFDVHRNIFSYSGGVYSSTQNTPKAEGHMVVNVGYGTHGGQNYWILQNSWGPDWGIGGYAMFLRGSNFLGIEEQSAVIRAWVKGGKEPPCIDSDTSGLKTGGRSVSCPQVKGGMFGNVCKNPQWPSVKLACMKTCGTCKGSQPETTESCPGISQSPSSPPPSPPPPPPPRPPPPPPTTSDEPLPPTTSDETPTTSDEPLPPTTSDEPPTTSDEPLPPTTSDEPPTTSDETSPPTTSDEPSPETSPGPTPTSSSLPRDGTKNAKPLIEVDGLVKGCAELSDYCHHGVVGEKCKFTCGTICEDAEKDVSPLIKVDGVAAACDDLAEYCHKPVVKAKCKKTCGC